MKSVFLGAILLGGILPILLISAFFTLERMGCTGGLDMSGRIDPTCLISGRDWSGIYEGLAGLTFLSAFLFPLVLGWLVVSVIIVLKLRRSWK